MSTFIDTVNEHYNSIVGEGNKIPVYIGAGTNPKRPVDGEPCKALLMVDGVPLVVPIVQAWHAIPETSLLYIVGPKERLEEELVPHLNKRNIDDYVLVNELEQGDAEALFKNVVHTIHEYDLRGPTLFSTCDMVNFDEKKARTILGDLLYALVQDSIKYGNDGLADFYFTIGDQLEDVKTFASVKDIDKKRSAIITGPYDMYRLGGVHLLYPERMVQHSDELVEMFSVRKTAHARTRTAKYAWKKLGYDTEHWYNINEGREALLKIIINTIKKYGIKVFKRPIKIPLPLPYHHVPIDVIERILSKTLGFKLRVIVTQGTEDIDFDEEYEAVTNSS